MKVLFLLAAIVVGLIVVGVIHVQKNGDHIDVSIDETKFKKTSDKLIEEGEQILDNTRQSINEGQSRYSDRESEYDTQDISQSRRFAPSPSQR